MASQRINPQRIKRHRIYTAAELAECCGVHKNTVRAWQRGGLEPVSATRPILFEGASAKAFLTARNTSRKRPCPPGMFYCFKCREPSSPALGMVEVCSLNAATGNLSAICGVCETVMHRRARLADIPTFKSKIDVQGKQAGTRIIERGEPSQNSDEMKD